MEVTAARVGEKVSLRRLGSDDLEYLYRWENAPEVWQYGDCGGEITCEQIEIKHDTVYAEDGSLLPLPERFSREQLLELIENQQYDIGISGQLRLVVCRREGGVAASVPVGFIDLFDFDAAELSAGVGILICDPVDRRKGYGRAALDILVEYARMGLGMRALWCTVESGNFASVALFSGAGFACSDGEVVGVGRVEQIGRRQVQNGEVFMVKQLLR
jgi:diamine N-acetyltransferase